MRTVELQALRFDFQAERTATRLRYGGLDFGWMVEDPDRGATQGMTEEQILALKVPKKTAIAAGYWPIVLRDSPSYGPNTLTVLVLGNRLVRIHTGNTEAHTDACLCPGLGLVRDRAGRILRTERSEPAVRWLEQRLVPHLLAGGEAWIRIERDPTAWSVAPFNPARLAA